MKTALALVVALAASLPLPALSQTLRIDAPAARLVVIPEARPDLSVVLGPSPAGAAAHQVRRSGGDVAVFARDENPMARLAPKLFGPRCERGAVVWRGRRWRREELPLITVRAPLSTRIQAAGVILGEIGPTSRLWLDNAGCGEWAVGQTRGLDLIQRGGGEIRVARVDGPALVEVRGGGRVTIAGGISGLARLSVNGSGQIRHAGDVGDLYGRVRGSGQIRAETVRGQAERSVRGIGDVTWGRPSGRRFCTRC
jgi:hypothetical protein